MMTQKIRFGLVISGPTSQEKTINTLDIKDKQKKGKFSNWFSPESTKRFLEKTRIAIVLSLVIYFVMYCASFACMFEQTPFHIKIILAIMPLVNLNLGVLLLSKFEYHFRAFHNRDFFINHLNYSLFNTYVILYKLKFEHIDTQLPFSKNGVDLLQKGEIICMHI